MDRVTTTRLGLDVPEAGDLDALHAIASDPRVWTHIPSLRPTRPEQTAEQLRRWSDGWRRDGLSTWVVRDLGDERVLGYCGCDLRGAPPGEFWNLGYRFAVEAQGRGLATEAGAAAIAAARRVRPEVPVVAYLLAHNHASARVAEKLGLLLQHSGPDAGNPNPDAVRAVYADRPLDAAQLQATLR